MDIKSPKVFETSDKAHADLFNDMVKVLIENDSGLLDQIIGHIDDTKPHASAAEKKKWNESQLYKITADDGKYLISVPADKNIYDAIKDKGTCTFIASPGVEDSPAPSNAYLRGIQTVGQDKIGTGFAVDTSGNAYYFYYNSNHISITWTQLPTVVEKDKWNNGQLYKLTQDSGERKPLPKVLNGTDVLSLPPGRYYAAGQYLTNMPTTNDSGWFNIDVDTAVTRKDIHVCRSFDNLHWFGTVHTEGNFTGWKRVITDADAKLNWKYPTIGNGWKTYQSEVNNDYRVRVAKDALGTVTVKGAIAGGTLGDVPAFTLPEGCEPVAPFYNLGVASSTGGFKGPQYSRQYIATDGRFCIQSTSSNTEFIVVNCMFKAKEG
ncbi:MULTISPECIES: hypothetical protein [Bacillus]|uniref:hypothetical protein n=1 Tax=Bacillus TaxID=1386 RepID=UPI0006F63CDF|nr:MULTISPECIES: hypothetical protein [Bacillus]KQU15318.1 hypothetical protein ASG46_00115 [Bacillus sp. Leaf49]MCS3483149.1 hypothetical protein [Bacillus sp. JUb11]MCY7621025.1 hypothetical protein [Bacillus altitudinis]MDI6562645.1 hypothetical protein [Bacillus altitudinis]MDI6646431.1 hypothetical protein [Bacillus altitudinis]